MMSSTSSTKMNLSGDELRLTQIRASGVKFPMISSSESKLNLMIRTGKIDETNSFPATIVYKNGRNKQVSNGKESIEFNPISGMVVKGKYDSKNKFLVDTIINQNFDSGLKESIRLSLENVGDVIEFPSNPMEVGGNFKQHFPMTIPAMTGMDPITINIVSIYTLKDIDQDKAVFDISQSVNLDSLVNGTYISALGDGFGKATFDISNQFIIEHSYELSLDFNISLNNMVIDAKTTISTKQDVEIK